MFSRLKLYTGQKASHAFLAVVIQGGGVDCFRVLWINYGGAHESLWLVLWLKVNFGSVAAPCTVRNADHCLTARGDAQAHRHVDVVNKVLFRIIFHGRCIPGKTKCNSI